MIVQLMNNRLLIDADKLPPEQKKHYEAINWLINGPRASGRSTLLALAFIQKALDYPNMEIQVFDHEPVEPARRHFIYALDKMCSNIEQYINSAVDVPYKVKFILNAHVLSSRHCTIRCEHTPKVHAYANMYFPKNVEHLFKDLIGGS